MFHIVGYELFRATLVYGVLSLDRSFLFSSFFTSHLINTHLNSFLLEVSLLVYLLLITAMLAHFAGSIAAFSKLFQLVCGNSAQFKPGQLLRMCSYEVVCWQVRRDVAHWLLSSSEELGWK